MWLLARPRRRQRSSGKKYERTGGGDDWEGDGWRMLDDAAPIRDEDGGETGETFGEAVAMAGKAMHLFCVEV